MISLKLNKEEVEMKKFFIQVLLIFLCSNAYSRAETKRRDYRYNEEVTAIEKYSPSENRHAYQKRGLKTLHTDAQSAINMAIEQSKQDLYDATQEITHNLLHQAITSLINKSYSIGRVIHEKITGIKPTAPHTTDEILELPKPTTLPQITYPTKPSSTPELPSSTKPTTAPELTYPTKSTTLPQITYPIKPTTTRELPSSSTRPSSTRQTTSSTKPTLAKKPSQELVLKKTIPSKSARK